MSLRIVQWLPVLPCAHIIHSVLLIWHLVCVLDSLSQKHNMDEDSIMPSLGKIKEFDPAFTTINRYLQCLEQYIITNGVLEDTAAQFKHRATFLSVIGSN